MKISKKLHRGTATAAGVIILVMMVMGFIPVAANVVQLITGRIDKSVIQTTVINSVLNAAVSLLMAIMLLRGKKDIAAGVVFALLAAYVVIRNVLGIIMQFFVYRTMPTYFNGYIVAYLLLMLIAAFGNVAFRALVALECFAPGKLSGSKLKGIFIVLPILTVVLNIVAYIPQMLSYNHGGVKEAILLALPMGLGVVIGNIGMIIMGVSFSIPVMEQSLRVPATATASAQAGARPTASKPTPITATTGWMKLHVNGLNLEVTVNKTPYTIGREYDRDLNLANLPNAQFIARNQATLVYSGGTWYIQDEGSVNGTYLNSYKLEAGLYYPLNKGDVISFSDKEHLTVGDFA